MNPHYSRMLLPSQFIKLSWVLFFFLTSSSYAQLALYDGSVGDANPVTQGWDLTLNPSVATVTPNPANDFVQIKKDQDFVGDPGDPLDWQYSLPSNLQSLQEHVGDDSYHWSLKFQLNEFIFMGFPTGVTRHTLADFNFYTGTDSGSAGYVDRVFIQAAGLRFPGALPQIRPYFAHLPSSVIAPTNPPGSPPEVDISPNWNSMLQMNELTFNRVGSHVEVFMNGDYILSGHTDATAAGISSTQVAFNGNSDTERVDMNWARFEVGDALPLVVPNPPGPEVLYDGSYFGGNPIKQGWLVEPLSPGLTLTPDAMTNSVRIESAGSPYRLLIPGEVRKSFDEANDDFYRWSLTFSVNEETHQSAVVKFTGDLRRETIQIEEDRIVVLAPGQGFQAAAGFDMIISPGETPNFTSMSDINEFAAYRKGDEIFMTVNGDIVFRGVGGLQDLTAGQFSIDGESSMSDFNLYAVSIATALDGDYDADNDVDQDDYNLWTAHFGELVPFNPPQEIYRADGNRNGMVDAADYIIWRKNVGMTQPFLGLTVPGHGAATGVPEPNSAALACLAMLSGVGLARRRLNPVGGVSLHRG